MIYYLNGFSVKKIFFFGFLEWLGKRKRSIFIEENWNGMRKVQPVDMLEIIANRSW